MIGAPHSPNPLWPTILLPDYKQTILHREGIYMCMYWVAVWTEPLEPLLVQYQENEPLPVQYQENEPLPVQYQENEPLLVQYQENEPLPV